MTAATLTLGLLERSEGQITVDELEQTLITAEGPLMRDLLQVLVDQRPAVNANLDLVLVHSR